jgi:hypothetical protein
LLSVYSVIFLAYIVVIYISAFYCTISSIRPPGVGHRGQGWIIYFGPMLNMVYGPSGTTIRRLRTLLLVGLFRGRVESKIRAK